MKPSRIESSLIRRVLLFVSLFGLLGCEPESSPVFAVEEPKVDCIRPTEPATYQVYFAMDVSGSMGPFLEDLRGELLAFATGLPEETSDGRRVRVEYRVFGFVNDVRAFGGRMTSIIALQAAFDDAIAAGSDDHNLNRRTFNAEREENLLDAIGAVIDLAPEAEARILFLATDAPFREAPAELSEGIQIERDYQTVLDELQAEEFRVHAFTRSAQDGLTRPFNRKPALTSLPGSTTHQLDELEGSRQRIRDTLGLIASEAACK